jgi:DNA-binding MarR family transcriptional regulator
VESSYSFIGAGAGDGAAFIGAGVEFFAGELVEGRAALGIALLLKGRSKAGGCARIYLIFDIWLCRVSRMDRKEPRITGPILKIIGHLLSEPLKGLSGADIARATGVSSGTLYPILFRLEGAGWLESEWELVDATEVGRPRRRLYHLTSQGAQKAKGVFKELVPQGGSLAWES